MKRHITLTNFLLALIVIPVWTLVAFTIRQQQQVPGGFILEHENDIKRDEPGSHNGGGSTTAYPFFSKDKTLKIAFRKRVMHPGSAIGYHLQKEDEIYYILAGHGILQMNGKDIPVSAGDAILTKPGSSHGLKTLGNEDLTVLINYDL